MRRIEIPKKHDEIWYDDSWRTETLIREMSRLDLTARQVGEELGFEKQSIAQYRRGIERIIPINALKVFLYQNAEA